MEPNKIDKVSQGNRQSDPSGGIGWCIAVGFSARALAEAVREAGFSVIAVDAFGDHDLRETAKVPQIISNWGAIGTEISLQPGEWPYYSEIVRLGESEPQVPVFLAGGCENWLELLEFLHSEPTFKVLGPSVSEMQALRRPSNWQLAVSGSDVRFPISVFESKNLDGQTLSQLSNQGLGTCDRHWLLKKNTSSGGLGVTPVHDGLESVSAADRGLQHNRSSGLGVTPAFNSPSREPSAGCYLQERIVGRAIGVSCLVTTSQSGAAAEFIGATESWHSKDWPAAAEFHYRGSFGPIQLTEQQQGAICRVVSNLVKFCSPGYVGWIQLDLIEDSDGQLWLLEVNPRWTAGMEVLRRSGLGNLAAFHAQACGCTANQEIPKINQNWSKFVGKAVYYPATDIQLTSRLLNKLHLLMGQGFSDIPSTFTEGSTIQAGHPLLTISAELDRRSLNEATVRQAVLEELYCQRERLERLLE